MLDRVAHYESLVGQFRDAHGSPDIHPASLQYCRYDDDHSYEECVWLATGFKSTSIGVVDVGTLGVDVNSFWRWWVVFIDTEECESLERTARLYKELATEAGKYLPPEIRDSISAQQEPSDYAVRWLTLLFKHLSLIPTDKRTDDGRVRESGLVTHRPFDKSADFIEFELLPRIKQLCSRDPAGIEPDTPDTNPDKTKKNKNIPLLPKTPGFRRFYNEVLKAEKAGRTPNLTEMSREIGHEHDLKDNTLADTLRRYRRWLRESGQ